MRLQPPWPHKSTMVMPCMRQCLWRQQDVLHITCCIQADVSVCLAKLWVLLHRADADALEGMLCLAAATQHIHAAARPELKSAFEPVRQESVSSDNDDYSEEQYVGAQRAGFPRGGHMESEEDKKEKR